MREGPVLAALSCVTAVVVGACQGAGHQKPTVPSQRPADLVPARSLGHASEELLINGWSRDAVLKTFGRPTERKSARFRMLAYGVPESLPEFDEQWVYIYAGELTNVVVYFHKGQVVLAIREWSDF
ncbi:MAG: hypothetical protein ACYTFI_14830 [Planctomycetota bacterium]|jgi:hypothetical protein